MEIISNPIMRSDTQIYLELIQNQRTLNEILSISYSSFNNFYKNVTPTSHLADSYNLSTSLTGCPGCSRSTFISYDYF